MKWHLLKNNRCAKCEKDLVKSMVEGRPGYITCQCGFSISQEQYQNICADRVRKQLEHEQNNEQEYDEETVNSFLDSEGTEIES
jgi:recombinational DNA repair protein RecR